MHGHTTNEACLDRKASRRKRPAKGHLHPVKLYNRLHMREERQAALISHLGLQKFEQAHGLKKIILYVPSIVLIRGYHNSEAAFEAQAPTSKYEASHPTP